MCNGGGDLSTLATSFIGQDNSMLFHRFLELPWRSKLQLPTVAAASPSLNHLPTPLPVSLHLPHLLCMLVSLVSGSASGRNSRQKDSDLFGGSKLDGVEDSQLNVYIFFKSEANMQDIISRWWRHGYLLYYSLYFFQYDWNILKLKTKFKTRSLF